MSVIIAGAWTLFRIAIVSLVAWFGVEWVVANLPNDTPEKVAMCIREAATILEISSGEELQEIVFKCEKVHGLNK